MNAEGWGDLELLDRILAGTSLSAAARTLGLDQTTVSRRLAAFERRIGVKLFDRIEGRLVPTPELAGVQNHLRLISEEASNALATLKRSTAELLGQVRITSVGFVLSRMIAPRLAAFAARHPGIALELIADDRALSLARREADIALRLGGSAEDPALVRKIATVSFGLYLPREMTGRDAFQVVRYGEALDHVPEMQAMTWACAGAATAFRSNRLDILAEAALSLGAAVMLPCGIGDNDSRFKLLDRPGSRSQRPLNLVLHPERRRLPSVARTALWVEEAVRSWTGPASDQQAMTDRMRSGGRAPEERSGLGG